MPIPCSPVPRGRVLFAVAWLLFSCGPLPAHEAAEHATSGGEPPARRAPGVAFGVQPPPPGMTLPQAEGPRPWSDKPVLNDPERFQIAIMTDRTGGHRPGVWMDAVRKVNLLRPEFVVSVGDLIEGYTEDRRQLEREWAEFLGFVDKLEMKFFFVPGNHDLTNPVMHELWKQKFGDEWYSFDYRGVHFICLCSEDPESRIGEEQLAWVQQDLEKNADARWTLVFLHKPLWAYAEQAQVAGNPDDTNWKRVESLLTGRPHTVFAGHVHHYVQYERNGGMSYYSLATTGGGSQLRGDAYGEFDHVMWLTMEADGPRLAVLKLDGIRTPGVVTEESAERFGRFLRQARVDVAPILLDNEGGFGEGDINLRLINQFGAEVQATAKINGLPLQGLTVEPESLTLKVGPTGTAEQGVHVHFAEPIDFSRLGGATLTATITTTGDNPLRAEVVAPVVIDRRHACPLVAQAPAIDGLAEPWPEMVYQTPDKPQVLGDVRSWNGPEDGSFAFHTSHDADHIYLAARVTDERLAPGDRLEVFLDGRSLDRRRDQPEFEWRVCRVSVAAPVEPSAVKGGDGAALGDYARWTGPRGEPIGGVESASQPIDGGYTVEIALPKSLVTNRQGDDWHSFQLALVQHDVDEPDGAEARVPWRGSPRVERSSRGYGYFVRTGE